MQHASATRLIHASPDEVWALISDVTAVNRWHPSVDTADLLSEHRTGLAATRRCNFYDGSNVREEVVDAEEGTGGPLGQLMGALMVRREMTKVAAKALAGLGHHAETGEMVGKDFVPTPPLTA